MDECVNFASAWCYEEGHVPDRDLLDATMQKVFDNGEILSLIPGHLSRHICVRLITTSQNFFKQGAPRIWRRLHTPQPLLFLLPGAKKVTKQHNNVFIEV